MSLPCTLWTLMQNLTARDAQGLRDLEMRRNKERWVIRQMVTFILWAKGIQPDLRIYWEWPHGCTGWSQEDFLRFVKKIWSGFIEGKHHKIYGEKLQ